MQIRQRLSLDSIRLTFLALFLVAVVATTAGCASTVIVEYAVKAQLGGRDGDGRLWQAQPEEFSTPPLPPGILVAFPSTVYTGRLFDWAFTPSAYGLSGRITNHVDSPMCFRFDQAILQSNFQIDGIPLRVYTATQRVSGRNESMVRLGSDDLRIRRLYIHPAYCFQTGQGIIFSFWPDLSDLFPTQRMFNVNWPEGVPELTDSGIGNWIKITIPIEHKGKRETVEATLTATDSKARISRY